MLTSFPALKYKTQNDSDIPTICAWAEQLVGEKLDYNNLSKEDFKELLNHADAQSIECDELNSETIELARQLIYNATKHFLPNKYYLPKDFLLPYLNQIEQREELGKNTLIMLYQDEFSFPAYKDSEGHIQFHNPNLLLVVHYNKVKGSKKEN